MRKANPTRAGLATGLGVVFLVGWGIQIATFAQQPQQQPQRVQQQLQQQQKGGQAAPRRRQQRQPRRPRAPVGRSVYGRDPFKFPFIGEGGPGGGGGGGQPKGPAVRRVPGKRGLVIARLKLEGIVLHQGELIAVVDDFRNRAFFVRESDVLYNGVVERITWDSIVFKENVLDSRGRVTTREVVRRLSSAPGEG